MDTSCAYGCLDAVSEHGYSPFFVFLKPVLFPQRYMFKSDKDVQERRGHLPPGLVYVQSFLRYLGGFVRYDASYECL